MNPRQLKKSEREALGRLQVVRVQPELALGSLADWLRAPPQLEDRGPSGESPGSQVGLLMALHLPSPYTRAALAGSGSQQIRHTYHELPALTLSTSPKLLTKVLVKALSQAQDGVIWRAGGGGKMKLE